MAADHAAGFSLKRANEIDPARLNAGDERKEQSGDDADAGCAR